MKILVSLLLLLVFGACSQPSPKASSSKPGSAADPCELLHNATFRSVKEHDVGFGPTGRVLGRLMIRFQGTNITFQVADFTETTTYTCANGVITARSEGHEAHGRFDPIKGLLVWNGIEYELDR